MRLNTLGPFSFGLGSIATPLVCDLHWSIEQCFCSCVMYVGYTATMWDLEESSDAEFSQRRKIIGPDNLQETRRGDLIRWQDCDETGRLSYISPGYYSRSMLISLSAAKESGQANCALVTFVSERVLTTAICLCRQVQVGSPINVLTRYALQGERIIPVLVSRSALNHSSQLVFAAR